MMIMHILVHFHVLVYMFCIQVFEIFSITGAKVQAKLYIVGILWDVNAFVLWKIIYGKRELSILLVVKEEKMKMKLSRS